MAEILPFVLAPASIAVIVPKIFSMIRQRQLRKTAKMLLKKGVKHALIAKDQIIF